MKYKKMLVVLSGGQDSTTCLYWAKAQCEEVLTVTIDYGQRHSRELAAARLVSRLANVAHEIVRMGGVLAGTSPLVNDGNAVENYASADALPGGIEKTFVPMRNAMFLVIAANRAVVHGCDAIVTGVSMEDYGGYPDCRAEFIGTASAMISAALGESYPPISILTPLLHLDKKATVDLAASLPGCMAALGFSHTCYNGEYPPCGTCHACLLRERGFLQAATPDPLQVRAASDKLRATA